MGHVSVAPRVTRRGPYILTVIASFSIENNKVLLGDLLVSSNEVEGRQIKLPTTGNIGHVFPPGSGFIPVGLKQKLCVIDDNLVVGWAGTHYVARAVIKQLKDQLGGRAVTQNDLKSFFENIDPCYQKELGIVGAHFDGKVSYTFGYNCQGFSSSYFGEVCFAGTGISDLKALMDDFEASGNPSLQISERNPLEKAIVGTLVVASALIGNEVVSSQNLLQYYGGGFEIVSRVKDRFEKIGDITYMFSMITEQQNGEMFVSLPQIVNKYAYHNDLLVIRSMVLSANADGSNETILSVDNDNIHVVTPINRGIIKGEVDAIATPSLNSRFTCNFYLLQRKDGSSAFLYSINYSSEKNNNISFDEKGEVVSLRFHNDFITGAVQLARENCSWYYKENNQ